MRTDPKVCVLKTCEREKDGPGALVCPDHWRLVPRRMKLRLWAAEHLRSPFEKKFQTMVVAGEILDFLEKRKILLPPPVKLAKPESELEKPVSNEPRIIRP